MPRDSNGNFSLIPSYLATTGQDIVTSQHNPVFEDVAAALTGSLPRNGAAPMLANLPFGGFKATGMAAGTAPTDGATKAQVDAASPIGIVADWAGATAPVGWLLCYGQAISRTDYPDLFAVCGTAYGAGNGSTTFNVPDLRGRVAAGKDNMGGTAAGRLGNPAGFDGNAGVLGESGGLEFHILTAAQLAAHTHPVTGTALSAGAHTHDTWTGFEGGTTTIAVSRVASNSITNGNTAVRPAGDHTHAVTGTATTSGLGHAHNNVQPTIILSKIIKAL